VIAYRALYQRFVEATEKARRVTSAAGLEADWPDILVGDMEMPIAVLGKGVRSWKRTPAEKLANAEEVQKAMEDRIHLFSQVEEAWRQLGPLLGPLLEMVPTAVW
jgi:hypothetical protein